MNGLLYTVSIMCFGCTLNGFTYYISRYNIKCYYCLVRRGPFSSFAPGPQKLMNGPAHCWSFFAMTRVQPVFILGHHFTRTFGNCAFGLWYTDVIRKKRAPRAISPNELSHNYVFDTDGSSNSVE